MATKKPTPRARPSTSSARSTSRSTSRSSTSDSRPKKSASARSATSPRKATSKRSRKDQKVRTLTGVDAPPLPPVDASKQARETALLAAQAGLEKKALDVEILDVAGKIDYADLLVLMTGTSDRHVASLVQNIEEELKKHKIRAISVEGMTTANWVLVDFGDVVVHVFQEEAREVYDIGRLWMDASRIPVPTRVQEAPPSSRSVRPG